MDLFLTCGNLPIQRFQIPQILPSEAPGKLRNDCFTPTNGPKATANRERIPAGRAQTYTMGGGKSKRHTHHCPKASKGNCRKTNHPTLDITYCSKHQYYCSVPGCTYTPIQGQGCLKHGKK